MAAAAAAHSSARKSLQFFLSFYGAFSDDMNYRSN